MLFGTIVGVIGFVIYKYVNKNKELGIYRYETIDDDYFIRCLIYCGVIGIFVISVVIIIIQIFDITTCFYFPEKIIIKELKCLL